MGRSSRILVAPDSFKGSLSAREAAEAICQGAERARPGAEIELCPLSDGGEGLSSVLLSALGGSVRAANVSGPMGDRVDAQWVLSSDGSTAVIESAAATGLSLVPEGRHDATRTTTFGVGELVREALGARPRTILVGLGGSATTDGGAGMAQALGVKLDGSGPPITGGDLLRVNDVRVEQRDPRLMQVELVALCDVDNPLTGPNGAARIYGPQKGASERQVTELDAALSHLASVVGDPGDRPGDGAAGGLGYGLRVFASAHVQSGIDYVLDATRFDERLTRCDLVLTGEGRIDAQSARGKVLSGVCRRSKEAGVPVVALTGAIGPGAAGLLDQGLTACFSICNAPMSEQEARGRAFELLSSLTFNVVRSHGWEG